ncbi:MAG TPA: hypothetical protein VE549_12940 [Myxococcaceae bacterium]|nr:hypothetical protein [Myxococcaceae bacterium]
MLALIVTLVVGSGTPSAETAKSYPWNAGAQRPITLPRGMSETEFVPGITLLNPNLQTVDAINFTFALSFRYGITDSVEYALPAVFSFGFGDHTGRGGWDAAVHMGISNFGGLMGDPRGVFWLLQLSAGISVRRMIAHSVAITGDVGVLSEVGTLVRGYGGFASIGCVLDLSERWTLDLSVTWIGRRRFETAVWAAEPFWNSIAVGGLNRPLVAFHLNERWDVLGTVGVRSRVTSSDLVVGAGFNFHM